jgi:alkylhydroperoxidase family enzyme
VEVLRRSGVDDETLIALQTDLDKVKTEVKEKALLVLAQTITKEPSLAPEAVIAASRAGWSDDEVAEAIFIASMYNMVNRVAVTFALPPDDAHPFDPNSPIPLLSCKTR